MSDDLTDVLAEAEFEDDLTADEALVSSETTDERVRAAASKIRERLVVRYLSRPAGTVCLKKPQRLTRRRRIVGGHKVFLRTGEYDDGSDR